MSTLLNEQPKTVISGQRARSGIVGHNVRYVLAVSLLLVVVALGAVYFGFFR